MYARNLKIELLIKFKMNTISEGLEMSREISINTIKKEWTGNIKGDILSGMTVAFALIPEAISFAIISGVNPMMGLYASFCIAILLSIFGGRPGMISAATGAMALVMVGLVKAYGPEYMLAATVLTGVIQFILGKFKFGRVIDYIPQSVITGFVNALAILIFIAQVKYIFTDDWKTYAIVGVTLGIIYLFPKVTNKVPSSLVAIIIMTIVYIWSGARLETVGSIGTITSDLPSFLLPRVPFTLETLKIILPYSLTLAFVGILESLLTAKIVDDMTNTPSNKNKEVKGQGIGNIAAGLFGGMPGCAMIGQSVINIKSGGRTRLSSFVSGALLLIFIVFLGGFIKQIPMAALAGVMVMVSISTFEWHSLKELNKVPKGCAAIMVITVAVIVFTHNLAIGVLVGVILSAIVFAWENAVLHVNEKLVEKNGIKSRVYEVNGQLFFASSNNFLESFRYDTGCSSDVVIDFKNSKVCDHTAVTAIEKTMKKFNKSGRKVSIVGLNDKCTNLIERVNSKLLVS